MRLNYNEAVVSQAVDGIQATIAKNDLTGSSLVIQGGNQRLTIKLADLIKAIEEQKEEEKAVLSEEAK